MDNYSSHDFRKNTDDAVVGTGSNLFPVNDCKVWFKDNMVRGEQKVEVSRLIQVFLNNIWENKKKCQVKQI